MNRSGKTRNGLIAGGVILVLAALLAFIVLGGQRDLPTEPLAQAQEPIVAPTMYVTPGDEGNADNGNDGESDDSNSSEEPQRQEENSVQLPIATVVGPITPGDGTDGPQGNPDPDTPTVEIPGIATNLGTYTDVTIATKPHSNSFTDEGRSGIERTVDGTYLWFYAYPDKQVDRNYSVLVEYSTGATGVYRTLATATSDQKMYRLPIDTADGAKCAVRLTLVDDRGSRTNRTANYVVTFHSSRNKPTIEVSFNGNPLQNGQVFSDNGVTILVKAVDHDGKVLVPADLTVQIRNESSGASITLGDKDHGAPSGAGTTYSFDFENNAIAPIEDEQGYTITVTATDESAEHMSRTVNYHVVYQYVPYGAVIGQVQVNIDATVVGLGVVASFPVDIHKGYPFAQDLVTALENNGIIANYTGTFDSNFYLAGLSSGGLFAGQYLSQEVEYAVEHDKVTITGPGGSDSLSEHNWTGTSGWLYCVNGGYWPSTTFNQFPAAPGDTVDIIFSLDGGIDLGRTGGGSGSLPTYCGTWRNGSYTEHHDISQYEVVEEPTCANPGRARYVCSVPGCGAWNNVAGSHANTFDGSQEYIILPPTENHTWVYDPDGSYEPYSGHDGVDHYVCSVCGAEKSETIPWVEPDDPDPDDPDPDDPDPDPENPDDPELEGQSEEVPIYVIRALCGTRVSGMRLGA